MLDDELIIETPERVELHFVLANVGNRFLAAAIDHLIQAALLGIVALLLWGISGWQFTGGVGMWAAAIGVLVVFVIIWGYFVLFETLWNGQTPGKRIMKLRVVREDGRPIRFYEAFVRNLLRLLVDLLPPISYAIGVVSIMFSPRSKRVGDLVAGTVVVKVRASEAPSLEEIIRISELEQRQLARSVPFQADMRLLGEQELAAISAFLKRRYELPDQNRMALAARIAGPIAFKLGITSGALPPEAFLEEIERQHRAQSRYFD